MCLSPLPTCETPPCLGVYLQGCNEMYSNSTTSSEMSKIVTPIHKYEKRFTGVQVSHDPTKNLSCWVLETLSPDSSIMLQTGNFDCNSTHDDDDDDHHHQQLRNSITQKFLNSLKKNEAL